jgi:hypothetical protein
VLMGEGAPRGRFAHDAANIRLSPSSRGSGVMARSR